MTIQPAPAPFCRLMDDIRYKLEQTKIKQVIARRKFNGLSPSVQTEPALTRARLMQVGAKIKTRDTFDLIQDWAIDGRTIKR